MPRFCTLPVVEESRKRPTCRTSGSLKGYVSFPLAVPTHVVHGTGVFLPGSDQVCAKAGDTNVASTSRAMEILNENFKLTPPEYLESENRHLTDKREDETGFDEPDDGFAVIVRETPWNTTAFFLNPPAI
jgi:hypothetical protein